MRSEFELVVSKEMIECQMKFVIPYEMKSNQMKFVFLKVPKIFSKQIASQHLKSLLSMAACDSLFSGNVHLLLFYIKINHH